MTEWLIILGMCAVTFLPRFLPLALVDHFNLPPLLLRSLSYIPTAVLTVIVVQNTVFIDGELLLSINNERIIAVAVAIIVALWIKKMSWVVLIGLLVYFGLKLI